jgi:hypothetical protein
LFSFLGRIGEINLRPSAEIPTKSRVLKGVQLRARCLVSRVGRIIPEVGHFCILHLGV